tara:strand:- start:1550 stop:1756 length:207 start_codon:yes stop_codon:yes gene_type:complete
MPLDLPLNSVNEKLPTVTDDLILWLREVYPDKMPPRTETLDEIMFKQGQISVVKALESINEELKNVPR